MTMKAQDRKKLWGKSGNICNFPECNVELVSDKQEHKVMGREAHIKGENQGSARYDPNQSQEERNSYENRILLCPNHHDTTDADPETWTVEKLQQIKSKHEKEVVRNRQFPKLADELKALVDQYVLDEQSDYSVSEVIKDPQTEQVVRVDASIEEGINTNIRVVSGQKIFFFARGLISFDGGRHFATPDGVICNERGFPLASKDASGNDGLVIFPHEKAYKTDNDELGCVGSLYGWIGERTVDNSFFIGCKREIDISQEGDLYLAVNDAEGTFDDNNGEFRVDIRIISEG